MHSALKTCMLQEKIENVPTCFKKNLYMTSHIDRFSDTQFPEQSSVQALRATSMSLDIKKTKTAR